MFEIAKLRLGYYRETLEPEGPDFEERRLNDTTVGYGLELPVDRVSRFDVPILIKLDFVKLPQQGYTQASKRWDKVSLVSLGINWKY